MSVTFHIAARSTTSVSSNDSSSEQETQNSSSNDSANGTTSNTQSHHQRQRSGDYEAKTNKINVENSNTSSPGDSSTDEPSIWQLLCTCFSKVDDSGDGSSTSIPHVPLLFGHYSMQGMRAEMEDRVTLLAHPSINRILLKKQQKQQQQHQQQQPKEQINSQNHEKDDTIHETDDISPFDNIQRSFFAVFDGHGGDVSAEYCRQHVYRNLINHSQFHINPSIALQEALLKTENDFCSACHRIHLLTSSGTTALCAYIVNNTLIVANIGDCRAVLCHNNRAVAVTTDHKPSHYLERQRIESYGGRIGITEHDAFRTKHRLLYQLINSICSIKRPIRCFPGGLSVSRTIGDISMKTSKLIIPEPEMFTIQLTLQHRFLVLCCDGVFDVLSNYDVINIVKLCLNNPKALSNLDEIAETVAKEAYRCGSTDNITVIVIIFNHQYMTNASNDNKDSKPS